MEILRPAEGDENPITASAHPVTRVYSDSEGIVCYERDGAEPIRLNQVSPKRSRLEALRRCVALLESIPDEHAIERNFPVSITGVGLTYNQLKEQTFKSCLQSRETEKQRVQELNRRKRKG